MASLRPQVLGGFKRVMRARAKAFKDDIMMLDAGKQQLREEVLKHKDLTDPAKIGIYERLAY